MLQWYKELFKKSYHVLGMSKNKRTYLMSFKYPKLEQFEQQNNQVLNCSINYEINIPDPKWYKW
jgi:hypothetical protein